MSKAKTQELYKHYKGSTYRVLIIAKHHETDQELVIYHNVKADKAADFWVRPRNEFEEQVEIDGELLDRFKRVVDPSEVMDSGSTQAANAGIEKEARKKLVGLFCFWLTIAALIVSVILVFMMYQDPTADVVYPMQNKYIFTIVKIFIPVLIIDFLGMLYTGAKRY